jgi:hypothetical protein
MWNVECRNKIKAEVITMCILVIVMSSDSSHGPYWIQILQRFASASNLFLTMYVK